MSPRIPGQTSQRQAEGSVASGHELSPDSEEKAMWSSRSPAGQAIIGMFKSCTIGKQGIVSFFLKLSADRQRSEAVIPNTDQTSVAVMACAFTVVNRTEAEALTVVRRIQSLAGTATIPLYGEVAERFYGLLHLNPARNFFPAQTEQVRIRPPCWPLQTARTDRQADCKLPALRSRPRLFVQRAR